MSFLFLYLSIRSLILKKIKSKACNDDLIQRITFCDFSFDIIDLSLKFGQLLINQRQFGSARQLERVEKIGHFLDVRHDDLNELAIRPILLYLTLNTRICWHIGRTVQRAYTQMSWCLILAIGSSHHVMKVLMIVVVDFVVN